LLEIFKVFNVTVVNKAIFAFLKKLIKNERGIIKI